MPAPKDDELAMIRTLTVKLDKLSPASRERVLRYIADRYVDDDKVSAPGQ